MKEIKQDLLQAADADDIAIVGMACHFPESKDITSFWENLAAGTDCIRHYTDEELEAAGVAPEVYRDPRYVKASGAIDGIEYFDAKFFEFSPREAALIDPQQRLFLEQAFKALEDANCNADTYQGLIGVYASAGMNTYLYHNLQSHKELMEESGGYPVMISSDKDFLATRTSYKLNLKGPSMTIQTACSSSAVALHCACQALRSGECDCAVAGGVSLRVPQNTGYLYQEGLILSPDGYCRAFDEKAQGTVFGSGAGAVVLKMMSDALEDGDCIYAAIKGSAINNDGSMKAGYTAPGLESQAAVIYEAMSVSGVKPEDISYVETHGTGTSIGDPIEIAALTRAFTVEGSADFSCAIGSVKTNIGHLDAAAGIAGVIKTALMLYHGQIPASLHFEKANPKINFADSPFYVNTGLKSWNPKGTLKSAGVSSFGIGGTNAHLILQEAPAVMADKNTASRKQHILTLSAKTDGALERTAKELSAHLRQQEELGLQDVCYTLAAYRKKMKHRLSILCADREEAADILEHTKSYPVFRGKQEGADTEVAFLFPGQGAQYVNMGLALYKTETVFRETMDECFAITSELFAIDLKKIIYPEEGKEESASKFLNKTLYTQPALFILEYSLARLLLSWGIRPKVMIGHSLGEYVAACLLGVFTLREAMNLVAARAKLISGLPEGSMLSVELEEQEMLPLLEEGVSIAAVNGRGNCVVSGTKESIAALTDKLSSLDIAARLLDTSHAFHSAMLEPILPAFREVLEQIHLELPQAPYLSTCTGDWMEAEEVVKTEYWLRHLRQTVRFYDASTKLMEIPDMAVIEVGPGKALSSLLRRHPDRKEERLILNSLPHPKEKKGADSLVAESVARLWTAGVPVDWNRYYQEGNCRKVRLPGYSFDRRKCWIEPAEQTEGSGDSPYFMPVFRKKDILSSDKIEEINCLAFTGEQPSSKRLLAILEDAGNFVTEILEEDGYWRECELLFQNLKEQTFYYNRILYLWGWEHPKRGAEHLRNLITLLAYLKRSHIRQEIRLTVVLQKSVDLSGSEELDYDLVSLQGLRQMVRENCPNLEMQIIDLGTAEEKDIGDGILERLSKEIMRESYDGLVAYRNRSRWVLDYESIGLSEKRETPSSAGVLQVSTEDINLTVPEEVEALKKKIERADLTLGNILYRPILNSGGTISFDTFSEADYQGNTERIRTEMQNIQDILGSLNPEGIIVLDSAGKSSFESCWLEAQTAFRNRSDKCRWSLLQSREAGRSEALLSVITGHRCLEPLPDVLILSEQNPLRQQEEAPPEEQEEDRTNFASVYTAPQNQTQSALVKIWEAILGTGPIGITDNFFELGGTSLMITQILSGVGKELGETVLTVQDLYANQTIRELAEYIEAVSALAQTNTNTTEEKTYEEGEI